jgi:hypothetical protein
MVLSLIQHGRHQVGTGASISVIVEPQHHPRSLCMMPKDDLLSNLLCKGASKMLPWCYWRPSTSYGLTCWDLKELQDTHQFFSGNMTMLLSKLQTHWTLLSVSERILSQQHWVCGWKQFPKNIVVHCSTDSERLTYGHSQSHYWNNLSLRTLINDGVPATKRKHVVSCVRSPVNTPHNLRQKVMDSVLGKTPNSIGFMETNGDRSRRIPNSPRPPGCFGRTSHYRMKTLQMALIHSHST